MVLSFFFGGLAAHRACRMSVSAICAQCNREKQNASTASSEAISLGVGLIIMEAFKFVGFKFVWKGGSILLAVGQHA